MSAFQGAPRLVFDGGDIIEWAAWWAPLIAKWSGCFSQWQEGEPDTVRGLAVGLALSVATFEREARQRARTPQMTAGVKLEHLYKNS